jgi:hypothetical protein
MAKWSKFWAISTKWNLVESFKFSNIVLILSAWKFLTRTSFNKSWNLNGLPLKKHLVWTLSQASRSTFSLNSKKLLNSMWVWEVSSTRSSSTRVLKASFNSMENFRTQRIQWVKAWLTSSSSKLSERPISSKSVKFLASSTFKILSSSSVSS